MVIPPAGHEPSRSLMGQRIDLLELATGVRSWASPLGPPLPVTGTAHRRSAVLLLFGAAQSLDASLAEPTTLDLLLTRRSDALRHHPGQIAFPGGGLDPGESPVSAALREAQEETGLDPHGVEVLGALQDVPVVVSGNVVTPVLAWWASPSALIPDGVETAEAFRVAVDALLDPDNRVTVAFHRGEPDRREGEGIIHRGPGFQVGPHLVWGFTAFVLDAVLDSLGWTRPWDPTRLVHLSPA